jgi:shikimate kinase
MQQFGCANRVNIKLKRAPGIYLVGFMGSGKSTVGRSLAQRLGWSFFDIDCEIERAESMTVAGIFEQRGEPEFRRIEHAMILRHVHSIERGQPAVVALGGGAFTFAENRCLLADRGITVWLDSPLEIVERRAGRDPGRPLARDPERFRSLYESRRDAYSQADVRVESAADDPEIVVEAIVSHPALR